MTSLLRLLGIVALLYVAVVALVWVLQRRLQYFPDRSSLSIPPADAAAGLQEVALQAEDGVHLRAWYAPGTRPLAFLLLHGNAGHRGDRLPWIRALQRTGASVLAPDYRGYGGSEGSPAESGLIADAVAARAWLAARADVPQVYLGESLGTGVAVGLAARTPPAALVLVSSFPSLVSVARRAYPWLPVRLLMRDRFECATRLAALHVPALFVHGEADGIVPLELGRAAFDAAAGPKTWWSLPGREHNEVPFADLDRFMERLETFLTDHDLGR